LIFSSTRINQSGAGYIEGDAGAFGNFSRFDVPGNLCEDDHIEFRFNTALLNDGENGGRHDQIVAIMDAQQGFVIVDLAAAQIGDGLVVHFDQVGPLHQAEYCC
jgi:hypothetical protein